MTAVVTHLTQVILLSTVKHVLFFMDVPRVDLAWLPEPGAVELEPEPAEPAEPLATSLDAAFGPEGLGLVCVTGDEARDIGM